MNTGVNTGKYTQPLNTQVISLLDFLYRFLSRQSNWGTRLYFAIGCNYSNCDNKYPEKKMIMMMAEQPLGMMITVILYVLQKSYVL